MDVHAPDPRPLRQPWQRHWLTCLLAACAGVGPVFVQAIYLSLANPGQDTVKVPDALNSFIGSVLTVAVFGGALLMLLYYICGERLGDLQAGSGTLRTDLYLGFALCFQLLATAVVVGWLTSLVGDSPAPAANVDIARKLSQDPVLLAVWLGPVIWLQAALYEEFARVFAVTRLWQVWGSREGKVLVIVGYSLLFGLGHLYEGPVGVAMTAFIGLVLGLHFLVHGRVWPLIIAHGLYNTIVLSFLVSGVREGLF